MKYTVDDIVETKSGKIVPISSDGNITGYGALIDGTIYQKCFLYIFSDGKKCNGNSIQEALDWMNSLEL